MEQFTQADLVPHTPGFTDLYLLRLIRISLLSLTIINLKNIQKKALGTIPLPKIKNIFRANLPTSGIYYKYGQYRKISEYSLSDGILTLTESVYDPNLQKFGKDEKSSPIEVKNLYDI